MAERKPEPAETVKRFFLVLLGSVFVQIFCWVVYDRLNMNVWLCGMPALIAAVLYHYIQKEQQTGLSRKQVFFAAILLPVLLSGGITLVQMLRYNSLNLYGAEADGVSPMTELISLYAARLLISGALLLVFSAGDALWLMRHPQTVNTSAENPSEECETHGTEIS